MTAKSELGKLAIVIILCNVFPTILTPDLINTPAVNVLTGVENVHINTRMLPTDVRITDPQKFTWIFI